MTHTPHNPKLLSPAQVGFFRGTPSKPPAHFSPRKWAANPYTRSRRARPPLVPGWYGCVSIKWVDEIKVVDDSTEATSQMQEYASRTHQQGVPKLARDFALATVDPAAVPIRVEKWLVNNQIKYRVVGILWGGSQPVHNLEIKFQSRRTLDARSNNSSRHRRFMVLLDAILDAAQTRHIRHPVARRRSNRPHHSSGHELLRAFRRNFGNLNLEIRGVSLNSGGAGESRTPDKQFRKLLLYPSELQPHSRFSLSQARSKLPYVEPAHTC